MNRKYLKYIYILIFSLIIFFLPNQVSAVTYLDDYEITNYDIDMVVNENNTFDITEKITAYFNVPKHGIFRKIPLKNSITRTDGSQSNNKARISNINVSEDYTTYNENGYKIIKIGNADKTLTGRKTYTIKYTYNIGKDPLKEADELYFNLIGNEWDTSISNMTFNIKMPKSFDPSLLGFSSGKKGSTNSSNISYTVNENTITGSLINTLGEGEGLTVRLTLPEGYFVGANNTDAFSIAIIIFCIVCVLIAGGLWMEYGKDDQVVETVEFYPPEGYNSAEIGYLYNGSLDDKSVVSLLVYLADKGYLKIEETSKGLLSKSKGFKITKLKEFYDGNNESERLFFSGLFKGGRKSVTASDLYDDFYRTVDKIKKEIDSKQNKKNVFEISASKKVKWLVLMILAIFTLITIKPIIEYGTPEDLPIILIFSAIGFGTIIGSLLEIIKMPKIFALIWGGLFGGIPWLNIVLPAIEQDEMSIIINIIGIISIVAIIIFAKIMQKRTSYGNEMLGKIKGFKRFLETAEKPQLESLVEQNPEYFYNILPYTYALGVSSTWMKQFESITLKAPDWYGNYDTFNTHDFNRFMNDTMHSTQTAMTSVPSSSSGGGYSSGGSSGGGSSGGGSGGGGGGSW